MEHMPVYVRVKYPKNVGQLVETLRDKMLEAHKGLNRIQILSQKEFAKIEQWKINFEASVEKINSVNDHLLEPEEL